MPAENDITTDNENLVQIAQDIAFLRQYAEQQEEQKQNPVYDKQFNDTKVLLQQIYGELEKQNISAKSDISSSELTQLASDVQKINTHVQNIENITIPFLVGFGLVIGVLCALIFSNFARH